MVENDKVIAMTESRSRALAGWENLFPEVWKIFEREMRNSYRAGYDQACRDLDKQPKYGFANTLAEGAAGVGTARDVSHA